MPYERTSVINETPNGAFVYPQTDEAADDHRVICSGCPALQETRYPGRAAGILAAGYHADHDPNQAHVPTRKH